MQSISTIGLDIAKSVFQVHGVDAAGRACGKCGADVRWSAGKEIERAPVREPEPCDRAEVRRELSD